MESRRRSAAIDSSGNLDPSKVGKLDNYFACDTSADGSCKQVSYTTRFRGPDGYRACVESIQCKIERENAVRLSQGLDPLPTHPKIKSVALDATVEVPPVEIKTATPETVALDASASAALSSALKDAAAKAAAETAENPEAAHEKAKEQFDSLPPAAKQAAKESAAAGMKLVGADPVKSAGVAASAATIAAAALPPKTPPEEASATSTAAAAAAAKAADAPRKIACKLTPETRSVFGLPADGSRDGDVVLKPATPSDFRALYAQITSTPSASESVDRLADDGDFRRFARAIRDASRRDDLARSLVLRTKDGDAFCLLIDASTGEYYMGRLMGKVCNCPTKAQLLRRRNKQGCLPLLEASIPPKLRETCVPYCKDASQGTTSWRDAGCDT